MQSRGAEGVEEERGDVGRRSVVEQSVVEREDPFVNEVADVPGDLDLHPDALSSTGRHAQLDSQGIIRRCIHW